MKVIFRDRTTSFYRKNNRDNSIIIIHQNDEGLSSLVNNIIGPTLTNITFTSLEVKSVLESL